VIIREIVGVSRFRSKDPYARFTGPPRSRSGLATPCESAKNRGGSQAVNCALHMIAVTQALGIGPARTTSPSRKPSERRAPKRSGCCARGSSRAPTAPCTPKRTVQRTAGLSLRLDIGVVPVGARRPEGVKSGGVDRVCYPVRDVLECPGVCGRFLGEWSACPSFRWPRRFCLRFRELYAPVRGCPQDRRRGSPGARTYGVQRARRKLHEASFSQVRGIVEVQMVAGCKTVGSAYVGSNPTPATTCANGPLAGISRLCGPFFLCPVVCVTLSRCGPLCRVHGHIADGVQPLGRSVCTVGFSRAATHTCPGRPIMLPDPKTLPGRSASRSAAVTRPEAHAARIREVASSTPERRTLRCELPTRSILTRV